MIVFDYIIQIIVVALLIPILLYFYHDIKATRKEIFYLLVASYKENNANIINLLDQKDRITCLSFGVLSQNPKTYSVLSPSFTSILPRINQWILSIQRYLEKDPEILGSQKENYLNRFLKIRELVEKEGKTLGQSNWIFGRLNWDETVRLTITDRLEIIELEIVLRGLSRTKFDDLKEIYNSMDTLIVKDLAKYKENLSSILNKIEKNGFDNLKSTKEEMFKDLEVEKEIPISVSDMPRIRSELPPGPFLEKSKFLNEKKARENLRILSEWFKTELGKFEREIRITF